MNITFVYDAPDEYWNDGLKKAIDIMGTQWNIRKQNGFFKPIMTDFVLVWGAFGSKQQERVMESPFKKGICIAGGPLNHPDIHKFDVVFVETKWQQNELRKIGVDAKLAFGTNTDLFKPIPEQPKLFTAIYPAAFALWKRHNLFADRYCMNGEDSSTKGLLFKPSIALGYMQANEWERETYDYCMSKGIVVLPQVKPEVLAYLYNACDIVYIPSTIVGGGERAVLEALACGIDVEVEDDNPKLVQLLKDMKHKLLTHHDYAKSLMEGIKDVTA